MSVISAQFTFGEYWTYAARSARALDVPAPPEASAFGDSNMDGKFVYAFGEVLGGPTPFVLVETYFLTQPVPQLFPSIQIVSKDSPPDGPPVLSRPVPAVALPVDQSGGIFARKYFFLALPRRLDPKTIGELEKQRPEQLPLVLLTPESLHFRNVRMENGKAVYGAPGAGATRVLFVVEPYSAVRHMADVYEHRCDRVTRFVKPEAGYTPDEQRETRERLAKHVLALEIEALRRAGANFDSQLEHGGRPLTQLLRDMDPHDHDGELAKRIKAREDAVNSLILFTSSPFWDLLDRDARSTDERGHQHYSKQLEVTAYAHRRLPESELGADLWNRLAEKFPMQQSSQTRAAATTALEFVAKHFVFAEHLEPPIPFHKSALPDAANALVTLHGGIASVLARRAIRMLEDLTAVLKPDAAFESWATGPLRSNVGLTAYRWAYHLRGAFLLERVTLQGEEQIVQWSDVNGKISVRPAELKIDFDKGEFSSKFPASSVHLEHVQLLLSFVSLAFSILSLGDAVEKKQKKHIAIMKTGFAAASFLTSPIVARFLFTAEQLAKDARPGRFLRLAGAFGAGIGALADALDARETWQDTGDGDVVLAQGATAAAGFIAAWGGFASVTSFAGPPGWVSLAGLSVALLGPLVVLMIQDTPLQDMVEHTVFGTKKVENQGDGDRMNKAPGMAVCEGGVFGAWAGSSEASLALQLRGLQNVTWSFAVAGGSELVGGFPLAKFIPQRLLGISGFEIHVRATWTDSDATDAREEVHEGTVFLHAGDAGTVRVESLSGEAFGGPPIDTPPGSRAILTRSREEGRTVLSWIIAPASTELRVRLARLRLVEVQLTVTLKVGGKPDASLVIPMTAPKDAPRRFVYTLARTSRTRGGRPVLVLNTDEVLSTNVYPS